MSDVTAEEWELLKKYYGDLAYEDPHNHQMFLATIRGLQQIEADEVEDIDDVLADMGAIIASGDISNHKVAEAMAILDRVPDVPPDAGDELK